MRVHSWYALKVDMTAWGKKKMRKSVLVMYVIVKENRDIYLI